MKSFQQILIYVLLLGFFSQVQGEAIFSASPGAGIASASFGVKGEKYTPYIGLDVIWLSFDINIRDSDFYMYTYDDRVVRYESTDETNLELGANLVIPHFGLKMSLKDHGDITTYFNGKVFIGIPFVKMTGNERHTSQYWSDYDFGDPPDDADMSSDEIEMDDKIAKEVLSFVGISLGYGVEYRFSDKFSVGSEFGIQMLFNSFDDSVSDVSGGSTSSYGDDWAVELNGVLRLTYVKLNLIYTI
jgi:hypothetical protein